MIPIRIKKSIGFGFKKKGDVDKFLVAERVL